MIHALIKMAITTGIKNTLSCCGRNAQVIDNSAVITATPKKYLLTRADVFLFRIPSTNKLVGNAHSKLKL